MEETKAQGGRGAQAHWGDTQDEGLQRGQGGRKGPFPSLALSRMQGSAPPLEKP